MEWLSIDDIGSCTRACKRLQALCDNHFRRKFVKSKEFKIRFDSYGKFITEKYVKYFNNFIKSLSVSSGNFDRINYDTLISFVNSKCIQNLTQISILGDLKLVPFCNEIEKVLRNVQIVQFWYRSECGRDESRFLAVCSNLTKITLYDMECEENVDGILGQRYPNLRHFHWLRARAHHFKAEKLKIFLKANDKIQCLAFGFLTFMGWQHQFAGTVLDCVETVVDCALNLEHLYLEVEESQQLYDYLKILCNRENFKSMRLKLVFEVPAMGHLLHLHTLANFKQLRKIHFGRRFLLVDSLQILVQLIHLKSIVIDGLPDRIEWNRNRSVDELINRVDQPPIIALPQIEELTIKNYTSHILIYLLQFARHCVKMKKLTVHKNSNYNDVPFSVVGLNQARSKLKDACELTIITDAVGNETNMDHELVKLKYVDSLTVIDN